MQRLLFGQLCVNVLAGSALLQFSCPATAEQRLAVEDVVRKAEQFIRMRHYDVRRTCPESLQRADEAKLFDMQRHCLEYDASEATAFAVDDVGELVRVYFRKSPREFDDGRESFRMVEVQFFADCPATGCVVLKDIELFLPAEARVL